VSGWDGNSLSQSEDYCCAVVVSCYYEKLVAEHGDSLGIQRKENICSWKLLPRNSSEYIIQSIGVDVIVNCEV
jgi:hypothetical protein